MKKLRGSSASALKIAVFLIILMIAFPSIYLGLHFNRTEISEPIVFAIPVHNNPESDWINAVKLVNELLHLNVSVYWLTESLNISVNDFIYTLARGDFVVPFQQNKPSDDPSYSSIFTQYIMGLSAELNVPVLNFSDNIEVGAYLLNEPNVAVFYGGGVTGGSLEHIHLLEDAGFNLSIFREEDLCMEKLLDYSVITFPGGGPYENYLTENDMGIIREFIGDGGGFLGTCGGMMLGVELGLLDVEPAIVGEYVAYADLRGPVLLNLTQSSNQIVSGYSTYLESTYFMGPFISSVGSDVEIIASYNSTTEKLVLYSPEIMEAYDFPSQPDVIKSFWGSPAILSGNYGSGKVVLSSVHPEILPISQRLFVNSVFYLSSSEEIVLDMSQKSSSVGQPQTGLYIENSAQLNDTLHSHLVDFLETFNDKSSNLQRVLDGLEEQNYQLVGVTGEYLNLFLADITSRSSFLLLYLEDLTSFYNCFDSLLLSAAIIDHKELVVSIENLQQRILYVHQSMVELQELIPILETVKEELLDEKQLIEQIFSNNTSSSELNQKLLSLHSSESQTIHNLKDNMDYHLLSWYFEIKSIIVEAHFLRYASELLMESLP